MPPTADKLPAMPIDPQSPLNAANPRQSAVVKASAGVGKTYLLVTRLIRLLLAGVKPDAILAITFTRKAAAEMQSRLAERLFEFVVCEDASLARKLEDIGVDPSPENCLLARELYERLMKHENPVRTTTFHSFCQDILRRFPMEADVPPAFELVENTSSLANDAWDALYEEVTLSPDDLPGQSLETLFDACGGLSNTHDSLQNFLDNRGDWWAYTQQQSMPVEFATANLLEQLRIDPDEKPLEQFFNRLPTNDIEEFIELAARHPVKDHITASENLHTALDDALTLEKRLGHLKDAFFTGTGSVRKRKVSATMEKKMGKLEASRFIEIHNQFASLLESFTEHLNRFKTFELCSAWYIAGQRLIEHFQRLKTEQRLLDFGDLEWKTYSLLHHSNNASWVQYKLDQRIEHFLIDEFQDTNPTQWQLILPLLQELADQEDGRSVFIVGDDKQSIYAFRRAEPKLLEESAQWIETHLGASRYPMDRSRRSASAIMETVNQTFSSDEGNPLLSDFHSHSTFNEDLWGSMSLLPLIEPDEDIEEFESDSFRNPLLEPRLIKLDTRHYREGQMIAQQMQRIVNDKTLIGAADSARPAHYGDFMILLRTRTHADDYETALREAGIPYTSATNENLLDALEIQDLLCLLQVLQAPLNNLALATVLRSPIFSCSDEDLMSIVNWDEGSTWFDKLIAMKESKALSRTLAEAIHSIEQWRQLAAYLPIHDLLDRIYFDKQIVKRYLFSAPSHLREQIERNLNTFINLALEVDSGRYPSVGRFLASLEELKQNGEQITAAVEESNSRVRIMTIHGSKGLEAPVVFIADAVSSSKESRPWRTLIHWPSDAPKPESFLLLGKKENQDPLTKRLLEIEKARFEQEDNNLLYVALTRARQHLFVSGCRPNRGSSLPGWYGLLQDKLGEQAQLDSGIIPQTSTATTKPQIELPDIDPRLSQAFELATTSDEINPSQALEDSEYQDDSGRHRGIAIHRFIELMSQDDIQDYSSLLPRVGAELGLPSDGELLVECYKEALQTFQHPDFAQWFDPQSYDSASNELPLQFRRGQHWVNGIIDRLIIKDDSITIIDYKTHRISAADVPSHAAEYTKQLGLYREGVKQLWPNKEVKALLLFTGPAVVHKVSH